MAQTMTSLAALREPAKTDVPMVKAGFDTVAGFELIQRTAKLFASSDIVPKRFQGNLSNCVIAVDMAIRMNANPLFVAQNLYVVHGQPGWSSKFLIATFNQSGRFSAIRYKFQGKEGSDEWGCRAVATELATKEVLEGPLVTIDLAKKEGWYSKDGSKWRTMPEQMLRYRAAAWFINVFSPEIAMGLRTVEEVRDTFDLEQGEDGSYTVTTENIRADAQHVKNVEVVDVETGEVTTAEEPQKQPRPKAAPKTKKQPTGQQISCPKLNEAERSIEDCVDCDDRKGCPAWSAGDEVF